MRMFMGPSLPKLLNLKEKPKSEDGKLIIPSREIWSAMYVYGTTY